MPSTTHYSPAVFRFLEELARNNDREWFAANRARYEEDVKGPSLRFISDFGPRLREISERFRADPRPVGGSLFRIHRDVRFSRDKSPYKTHVGLHFRHERAKDVHAPGFYLHLEPEGSFAGAGIWRPASGTLRKIRETIVEDPEAWKRASRDGRLRERFRLGGDSLVRGPRGFDPRHPLMEDLKRKDFIVSAPLAAKQVTSPNFLDDFTRLCAAAGGFVRYLCEAIGVPY